jgi:hypothetical protein
MSIKGGIKMIDTIKFDIPVHLSEDEIRNIRWTKTNTTKSKNNGSRLTVFRFIHDENKTGDPHILYVYKKDNPSKSWLKVEVSAPKFLFGNNVQEIDERNLNLFMSQLRKHIALKLNLPLSRIPSLWTTEIEKLHVCKNFYVGNKKQQYLKALSITNKARHQKLLYYQNGTENIESIYWNAESRKEKIYDKEAEIEKNHSNTTSRIPSAYGIIRYEIELSNYDLRKLSSKRIAREVLKFNKLEELLQNSLDRLGISQCQSITKVVQAIQSSQTTVKQKQKLIKFAYDFLKGGESSYMDFYSRSGFYKLKKQLETLLGVTQLLITEESLQPFEIKKETVHRDTQQS